MRKGILFLGLLFASVLVRASGFQPIIAEANKAYSEGQYEKAAGLYREVLQAGYEAPDLYYNLGNACYKMNDLPSAILNYERAKRLDPGNEDIEFNLQLANTKIADKIEPLPVLFYKRWFGSLVKLMAADAWARVSIIALVAALLFGLIYFLSRMLLLRKIGFWGAVILLLLSLSSILFAWQNYQGIRNTQSAIVFAPTVTVKSSPDENSVELFVLHEGTKVELIDHIGTWYEIRIANGSVGWLPLNSVEKI
ncbi:MAG TPA: tetratricopeptide repeat protein [Bacteroidales bacterium]|nr:tetratricopeptide repeat protein [Bacteroidales bacterium]